MAKTPSIPWLRVRADYLQGMTVKALSVKYNVNPRTISTKACHDNWNAEKVTISNNLQQKLQKNVEKLTDKALTVLSHVMSDEEAKNADRVAAARAILDVSGLKAQKTEVTGTVGALSVQKIYITPDEVKEAEKHINKVINGQ